VGGCRSIDRSGPLSALDYNLITIHIPDDVYIFKCEHFDGNGTLPSTIIDDAKLVTDAISTVVMAERVPVD